MKAEFLRQLAQLMDDHGVDVIRTTRDSGSIEFFFEDGDAINCLNDELDVDEVRYIAENVNVYMEQ